MTIVEWIFVIVSIGWISEFIFFRNRGVGKGDPIETRSFFYILSSLVGTLLVAVTLQEMRDVNWFAGTLKIIGLMLFCSGVILRFYGIIHLKNQFTRHVTVRLGDQIVSSGPYKNLRHPLYTGLLMITIGMALFFNSMIAAVLGGVVISWTLLKRIEIEEKLLIAKFGEDYQKWMKKRARLIPYIY